MQENLFGEPTLNAELSQFHTPPTLARKVAGWVPRGARILEPSVGGGAIVAALLRAGHQLGSIAAAELDVRWVAHLQKVYPGLSIWTGDFLSEHAPFFVDDFDVVCGNFPFEDNLHLRFALKALQLAPVVIGVFPSAFQFTRTRDRELWATHGVVTRRAILPDRVPYTGSGTDFDSVVLQIERRSGVRAEGEQARVLEEVWSI